MADDRAKQRRRAHADRKAKGRKRHAAVVEAGRKRWYRAEWFRGRS